jgi:hypothetical protein
VRFDGIRFTIFDRSNTPAFRDDSILVLYPSRDGADQANAAAINLVTNGSFEGQTGVSPTGGALGAPLSTVICL